MRAFYCVFYTYLAYKKFKNYLVNPTWVFKYYLEITNGPNTNSTILSQLFKYQIIRIIRSNSDFKLISSFSAKSVYEFERIDCKDYHIFNSFKV